MKGRGLGKWKRGEKISSLAGLPIGCILIEDDKQFGATNLVKITRHDDTGLNRDIVYGSFMYPDGRLEKVAPSEFAIWGHDLNRSDFYYAVKDTTSDIKVLLTEAVLDLEESRSAFKSVLVMRARAKIEAALRLIANEQGEKSSEVKP